jgi:putative phage-type endonuclease
MTTSHSNHELLFDIEQGSLEWHELRQGKYNASEAGAVMEVNPWRPKDRRELAAVRSGELVIEINKAMTRGNEFEGPARQYFSELLGQTFTPCIAVRGEHSASLDGINGDHSVILELKVPMNPDKLFAAIVASVLPDHYWYQIAQQAWCAPDSDLVAFAAYDPKEDYGRHVLFDADTLREVFETEVLPAWQTFKGTNYEPVQIDQSKNKEWCKLAKAWSDAKKKREDAEKEAKIAELKKAEKTAKDALIAASEAGTANVGHGVKVGWTEVGPKISKGSVMKRVSGSYE